jgi:hypothetical protein
MPSFPTLSSGSMRVTTALGSNALMKHPSQIQTTFMTKVIRFVSDDEQRWPVQQKLMQATLNYSRMNGYDTSLVREFFYSQKGSYVNTSWSNTFDIVIDGVTYAYCVFDQDEFVATENPSYPGTYSFSLKIRKLRKN